MSRPDHRLRFHSAHLDTGAFGGDSFGRRAEAFARFFGTPVFLVSQTIVVGTWIAVNALWSHAWDVYPFILLNLLFSTQAAYAAPLILLAQTRQADRDKALAEADAKHREDLAAASAQRQQIAQQLIEADTALTEQVAALSKAIHEHVTGEARHAP